MVDDPVLELAEQQFGLVSATQLRALGLPAHSFADRAAGRHWEAINDELLRRVGAPDGRGRRAMAGVLDAGPGAALSHSSGASWWGVPGCELDPLHVTRTSRTRRRPSEVDRLHTVRRLPARWVTQLDGVPIVRPELLAVQLFAQFRYERAERHVDALWSMRLLSGRALHHLLDDLGRRGRDGIGGLRRYLADRGGGYVPPASGLEGRAISILAGAGIPMLRQVDSGGERWDGRVDLRHESEPVVVEVQSDRYHRALSDRRDDAARVARLGRSGFEVVEVWESQVWHRPWEVVGAVHAALARARSTRSARLRGHPQLGRTEP